jgi:hypothetical protein
VLTAPSPSRGKAAIGAVLEVGLPLAELGARPGDFLDFAVSFRTGKDALDRLPQSGYASVCVPSPELAGENWSV